MLASAILLTSLGLEGALLVRSIQGRFVRRYALFYSYLAWVLLLDLLSVPLSYWFPRAYSYVYWSSEFLSVLIGCGVVWEIYRTALSRYPGAARMAQNVLAFLFIISVSRIFVKAWNNPNWHPGATTLETERDLRIVQTLLLAGLVVLLVSYAVPISRNIKGMILGFGFFLATSVVNLTARDYFGETFEQAWSYIQPVSYLVVLGIWLTTLWAYSPAPEPEVESRLEVDYQALVAGTRRQLISARAHLARTMKP